MCVPEFSIVVPTRNRPYLLTRALQSVLRQTYKNFECVVVDDTSDYNVSEVVEQFDDDRFVLVRHKRNLGAAASYNTGIKATRGEFICILDDDDEYMPSFLEKTRLFFQNASTNVAFVWTGIRRVKDDVTGSVFVERRIWTEPFSNVEKAYIVATTIGNGYGLTMKRECLNKVGFYNEDFMVGEDTEYLFRLARNFEFASIPEELVVIHTHSNNQLTHCAQDKYRVVFYERILRENADFVSRYPELFYIHYRRIAQLYFSLEMNQKGKQIMLLLWKKKPSNLLIPLDLIFFFVSGSDFRTTVNASRIKKWLKFMLR